MNARSSAAVAVVEANTITTRRRVPEISWVELARRAPQMASTMARYLDQLAVSARPATVTAVELDVATVRRLRDRYRPGLPQHGPGPPSPLRGLQTMAGPPTRPTRHPHG